MAEAPGVVGASKLDPVTLTQEQAARFYREMVATTGRTAASSQVQARAAMAFAYEQWDRPNPFAKIKPPKSGSPPPVGYLQAHDLARLLDFLSQQQATYGESLTYHLAAALFYTCSRYSEIAHLRWNDCLLDGSGRIVALRIKGKGSVHATLPVNAILSRSAGRVAHDPGAAPGHEGVCRAGTEVLPQRVRVRRSRWRAVHQPEL